MADDEKKHIPMKVSLDVGWVLSRKAKRELTVDITKLSTKGQIVIPEAIRELMNLEQGDCFIVRANGNQIILELISDPEPASPSPK